MSQPDASFRNSLSNIVFDGDGGFYATVDSRALPNQESPITFYSPFERSAVDLTSFGKGVSEAVREGKRFNEPDPSLYANCDLTPCVAVTFDDGPSALTRDVLEAFDKYSNAAATFFVLGQNVEGREKVLQEMVNDGHEIGGYSWSHPVHSSLSEAEIVAEASKTLSAVKEATGVEPSIWRPPYGDYTDEVLSTVGLPAILWSVDTNDWQKPGEVELVRRAVEEPLPGDIILLHNIHPETTNLSEEIVDGLYSRGFSLVTVSQLIGKDAAVKAYYCR